MAETPAPGWYADPGGGGGQRFWDGFRWTGNLRGASDGASGPFPPRGRTPGGAASPAAGWYPDPSGASTQRYWDGVAWTGYVQPLAPAQSSLAQLPPPTGRPHADQARRPPGRRPGLLVGAGLGVLVLMGGLIAWQVLFSLGAPTPVAAAEGLVEAANERDLIGVYRLLPPDEIGVYRSVSDRATDRFDAVGPDDDLALDSLGFEGISVDVRFGPPQELAEGLVRVPVDRIGFEVAPDTPDRGVPTSQDIADLEEDLRGEDVAVIAVERDGSWFVSPVGTFLDVLAREEGRPAGPAVARPGSATPGAVVDGVGSAWSSADPVGLLGLLDPDELRVLDHYTDLLRPGPGDSIGGTVSMTYQERGSEVRLLRAEFRDDWGVAIVDLERWCVEEDGQGSCLDDLVRDDLARGVYDPWAVGFMRALLDPEPPEIVVGTVQREDRHYLSLERTVEAMVDPLLDRMDDHTLAGILFPTASPHATDAAAAIGEEFTVSLVDGWAAVRFPEHDAEQILSVCPPAPELRADWTVNGVEVVSGRVFDPFEFGGWSPGVVVGVHEGAAVDTIQLRIVDAASQRC